MTLFEWILTVLATLFALGVIGLVIAALLSIVCAVISDLRSKHSSITGGPNDGPTGPSKRPLPPPPS